MFGAKFDIDTCLYNPKQKLSFFGDFAVTSLRPSPRHKSEAWDVKNLEKFDFHNFLSKSFSRPNLAQKSELFTQINPRSRQVWQNGDFLKIDYFARVVPYKPKIPILRDL